MSATTLARTFTATCRKPRRLDDGAVVECTPMDHVFTDGAEFAAHMKSEHKITPMATLFDAPKRTRKAVAPRRTERKPPSTSNLETMIGERITLRTGDTGTIWGLSTASRTVWVIMDFSAPGAPMLAVRIEKDGTASSRGTSAPNRAAVVAREALVLSTGRVIVGTRNLKDSRSRTIGSTRTAHLASCAELDECDGTQDRHDVWQFVADQNGLRAELMEYSVRPVAYCEQCLPLHSVAKDAAPVVETPAPVEIPAPTESTPVGPVVSVVETYLERVHDVWPGEVDAKGTAHTRCGLHVNTEDRPAYETRGATHGRRFDRSEPITGRFCPSCLANTETYGTWENEDRTTADLAAMPAPAAGTAVEDIPAPEDFPAERAAYRAMVATPAVVGGYVSWDVRGEIATARVQSLGDRYGAQATTLASDGYSECWPNGLPSGTRPATEEEAAGFELMRAGRLAPVAYE